MRSFSQISTILANAKTEYVIIWSDTERGPVHARRSRGHWLHSHLRKSGMHPSQLAIHGTLCPSPPSLPPSLSPSLMDVQRDVCNAICNARHDIMMEWTDSAATNTPSLAVPAPTPSFPRFPLRSPNRQSNRRFSRQVALGGRRSGERNFSRQTARNHCLPLPMEGFRLSLESFLKTFKSAEKPAHHEMCFF